MTFAFFGTDELAVTVLETLKESGTRPTLIISTPDAPKGRKLVLTPPPVKVWANLEKIPCLQPTNLKEPEFLKTLQTSSCDFYLVASYGKIIPQRVIEIPPHGTLNIHPSLLPRYRGPAPLAAAILGGDSETGVTIIKLDNEVDHGPIVAQSTLPLTPQTTFPSLRDELAREGAKLFMNIVPEWLAGNLKAKEQDHAKATFTTKIEKVDGLLDLADPAEVNDRKIRAYTPWPGTYFFVQKDGQPLRIVIKEATLEDGTLKINRVVPEGKREMSWEDFARNLKSEPNS